MKGVVVALLGIGAVGVVVASMRHAGEPSSMLRARAIQAQKDADLAAEHARDLAAQWSAAR